jgi:hypothetical protein
MKCALPLLCQESCDLSKGLFALQLGYSCGFSGSEEMSFATCYHDPSLRSRNFVIRSGLEDCTLRGRNMKLKRANDLSSDGLSGAKHTTLSRRSNRN